MKKLAARLRFLIARTLRDEGRLRACSVPASDIAGEISGKTVAIVGNARALAGSNCGPQIDAADIVVRINRAPIPDVASHGSRTDWLALATGLNQDEATRINPRRILWMSHKRKRLPAFVAASQGFYLHDLDDWRKLHQELGAPPSTGAMITDLIARSEAATVNLFGFDFFASKSLSGRRAAAQVPHDFASEARWVEALLSRDPRFTLIPL